MAFIGIDVGGTNVRGALVDCDGRILTWHEERTPVESVDRLIDSLTWVVLSLKRGSEGEIRAVGVGFPGLIDVENGVVKYSPNLPAYSELELAELLADKSGLPVFLANDANLAAVGEMWLGGGRDFKSFVLITLGTGLGSGLIIDGKPFWGGTGYAAELGHITVEPDGERCGCGQKGCLEAYCSATGLVKRANRLKKEGELSSLWEEDPAADVVVTPEAIDEAASDGDGLASLLLLDAARYLGIAVAGLVNVAGIEAAVVGGRMANMSFDILRLAEEEANSRAMTSRIARVKVVKSQLGDRAGCLGAARYAMDKCNE